MKHLLHRVQNLLDLLIFGKPHRPYWIAPQSLPYHPLYFARIESLAEERFKLELWNCALTDTDFGKHKPVMERYGELVKMFLHTNFKAKHYFDDNYHVFTTYKEMTFYQLMHTGECKTQSIYHWEGELRRKYDHIELARTYNN